MNDLQQRITDIDWQAVTENMNEKGIQRGVTIFTDSKLQ
jgi:hypothetical protein